MKNFEDMGIIEMAKTLGEMGDQIKNDDLCKKHGIMVCEPCAYEKGFSEGITKAASMAENTWDYIPQETWDEGFEPDYELTQKIAAERILALRPESEGKK
jgi:hypothetical protein